MKEGYAREAWHDISASPNWLGKVTLLALISMVPVIGDIVLFGYLLGWSRDLSWGVRAPLPSGIFKAADSQMLARGVYYVIISILFRLLPAGVCLLLGGAFGYAGLSVFGVGTLTSFPVYLGIESLLVVLAWLTSTVLIWVGAMRMCVYERLAPGLQVNKIVAMVRQDAAGLLRILGMVAVLAMISLFLIVLLLAALAGVSVFVVNALLEGSVWREAVGLSDRGAIAVSVFAIFGILALYVFMASAVSVFVEMLVYRSLGYWMIQFDVPHWGGQDDLMPFQILPFSRR